MSKFGPNPYLGNAKPQPVSRECATPGPLSINPPMSDHFVIKPQNYARGFNNEGRIIGTNEEIPNPCGPSTRYFETPFYRHVDWYRTDILTDTEAKSLSSDDMMRIRENRRVGTQKINLDPSEGRPTLHCELLAESDPAFNEMKEKKLKERRNLEEKRANMRLIPPEIKNLPGHCGPSVTRTESEKYGQYLDLRPKLPSIYPLPEKLPSQPMRLQVRFRKSNFSDHPPIPDHSFAVDPREMLSLRGCYTSGIEGALHAARHSEEKNPDKTIMFRTNALNLSHTVGERQKGFTLPLYSPTGFELNRPIPHCVSVLTGRPGTNENGEKMDIEADRVPYIYTKYHTDIGETTISNATSHPEAVPKVCKPQKKWCHPQDPKIFKDKKCDPCHIDFINAQTLPRPLTF